MNSLENPEQNVMGPTGIDDCDHVDLQIDVFLE